MEKEPEPNRDDIKKITVKWKWIVIIFTILLIYMSTAAWIYVSAFRS